MRKITVLMLTLMLTVLVLTAGVTTVSAAGDTIATATSISLGTTYYGSITETSTKEVYKFTLNSSGRINIDLKASIYESNYYLYDANGEIVWKSIYRYWNGTTEIMSMTENIDLTTGTYYFAVEKQSGTGSFNFKLSYVDAKESFTETLGGNNQDVATADLISLEKTYNGQIAQNDNKDIYKFELSSSGRINISLEAGIYETNYYLYDVNGETVWKSQYRYWNGTTEIMSMDETIDLTKGTYYFAVVQQSGTGNYNYKISYIDAKESFVETLGGNNQDVATADLISLDKTYNGQIAQNDNKDIYKFELSSSGRINISLEAGIYETNYYLYDVNGETVWKSQYRYWNGTTEIMSMDETVDLTKGTYYFAVVQQSGTGNYNYKISYIDAKESFVETLGGNNQDVATADLISLDKTYNGQIAQNDGKDIYKFSLDKNMDTKIKVTSYIYCVNYFLYDANGNTLWSKRYTYWDDTSKKSVIDETLNLNAGTYYFVVERHNGTGNYSFSVGHVHNKNAKSVTKATLTQNGKIVAKCSICGEIVSTATIYSPKTITLSKTAYTYNGKAQTPTVTVKDSNGNALKEDTDYTVTYSSGRTLPGKYNVTVTFKGNYSGSKTLSYAIVFKAPTGIKTAVSASAVKLTWSKVEGADGYRVYMYDTSAKKWVNKKTLTATSYTIKNLKSNTTYQFKLIAYKKSGDSVIWGEYTSAIKATTKLAAPATIKTAVNASAVKLAWSKVAGATGYRVYMYDTSAKKWVNKKTLTGTSLLISNLKFNVTYQFKVIAYKKTGSTVVWGDYSPVIKAKTKLPAPSGIKIAQNESAIKLTWNKVAGATGYRVYMYNTSTKKWVNQKTLTGTSLMIKNLKAGTTYQFKIIAYKKSGSTVIWGNYTAVFKASTRTAAPKITAVASTAKGRAAVAWSNVAGETGYELWASTKKDSGYKKIVTAKADVTKGVRTGLVSGRTYYFKVRAYKTVGSTVVYSAWSTPQALKIK